MQTVIFACRACSKEMSVAEELLGHEVRCPHCQQVVLAPTPVPAAVPAGETVGPSADGAARAGDSIFDAPVEADEGMATQASTTTTVFLPGEGDTASGGSLRPKYEEPTTEFIVPEKDRTAVYVPLGPADAAGTPVSIAADKPAGVLARSLLTILIPYAILMTIAAVWFYVKSQQVVHPLEALPDWPRDNETPVRQSQTFQRIDDSQPLPPRLRVALGRTLRIGDLEVTPEKLERRPIVFCYERSARREEPSRQDALVLTLRVHNRATHTAIAPNDLFFNRQWREGMPSALRPYTCLEIGSKRFYGGPCAWRPRQPGNITPREFVAGTEYNTLLDPGADLKYAVCTDPENTAVLAAVEEAGGALVWRVQLRCGTARVRNREESITAVIGVEFQPADIQRNQRRVEFPATTLHKTDRNR